MTNDKQKRRGRGRPRTGISPPLNARVSRELMARIDASADANFETRPYAIRRLLIAGLRAERAGQ